MMANTEQETAAALSMQYAAGEIAAILSERMHSLDAGCEMAMEVSGTLISAAWLTLRLWEGEGARVAFAALLRHSADKIDRGLL